MIQLTVPDTVVVTCMAPDVCVRPILTVPLKLEAPVNTLALLFPFLARMVRLLTAPELQNHASIILLFEGSACAKMNPCTPDVAV